MSNIINLYEPVTPESLLNTRKIQEYIAELDFTAYTAVNDLHNEVREKLRNDIDVPESLMNSNELNIINAIAAGTGFSLVDNLVKNGKNFLAFELESISGRDDDNMYAEIAYDDLFDPECRAKRVEKLVKEIIELDQ